MPMNKDPGKDPRDVNNRYILGAIIAAFTFLVLLLYIATRPGDGRPTPMEDVGPGSKEYGTGTGSTNPETIPEDDDVPEN
ncbi:MAG: hypothetical protein ACOH5I_09995 [Oligoflexus sp.]